MNKPLADFLYFTRRERSGVLLLLTFCLLGYGIPWSYPMLSTGSPADFSTFEKAAAALDSAREKPPPAPPEALFPFDPNRASLKELMALGLPRATARTILNYREKGGRFRHKSDLRKIYTLRDADYRRLAPYIDLPAKRPMAGEAPAKTVARRLFSFDPKTVGIQELQALGLSAKVAHTFVRFREAGGAFEKPEDLLQVYGMTREDVRRLTPYARFSRPPERNPTNRPEASPSSGKAPPLRIDVNRTPADQWQQLYGIGPVLSKRIVRFREKLGGFSSIDQIRETYGLPDSTFENIAEYLQWSPIFRPLAVNHLGWKELSSHPYLNRRQAQAIVAYRRQHGLYTKTADLDSVLALPKEGRHRLEPYWTFE